ncbi:hypothetical protein ACFQUU_25175 [Herbaspirillum sp. GCM10030257]|uniref:hypothetical protein n=1 Tax=Herbaspirillum sp. GCM10030257 TaxID=3273393 RepID=UPI00360B6968
MQPTLSIVKFIVPVLLPIAAIMLAWGTGTKGSIVRARLVAALGGGQLLWVAMVIASYGASEAMAAGLFKPDGIAPGLQALLIGQGLLVLLSARLIDSISQTIVGSDEGIQRGRATGQPLVVKGRGRALYSSIAILAAAIGMAVLTEAWIA